MPDLKRLVSKSFGLMILINTQLKHIRLIKEKETDNDKYAFRCFLLRLGFIGSEYKAERKILLRNLTGSSAFKNGGTTNEVSE